MREGVTRVLPGPVLIHKFCAELNVKFKRGSPRVSLGPPNCIALGVLEMEGGKYNLFLIQNGHPVQSEARTLNPIVALMAVTRDK